MDIMAGWKAPDVGAVGQQINYSLCIHFIHCGKQNPVRIIIAGGR